MSDLTELQNKFQDYLLQTNTDFKASVLATENVSVETRLGIYKDAYRLRLIEALAANYPALKKYLGDEAFNQLSVAYLIQYPSTFRSIRWFGAELADFLMQHEAYLALPVLSELARFEWLMTIVFDAPNDEVLRIESIAAIAPSDWPHMRFRAHASLLRLDLKWNVVEMWQKLVFEETPPPLQQKVEPQAWLLWRKELTNQFCSLVESEAYAIDAMRKGATFGEICEGLCQWVGEEEVGLHAASLLKGWTQSGLLASVEIVCESDE